MHTCMKAVLDIFEQTSSSKKFPPAILREGTTSFFSSQDACDIEPRITSTIAAGATFRTNVRHEWNARRDRNSASVI